MKAGEAFKNKVIANHPELAETIEKAGRRWTRDAEVKAAIEADSELADDPHWKTLQSFMNRAGRRGSGEGGRRGSREGGRRGSGEASNGGRRN